MAGSSSDATAESLADVGREPLKIVVNVVGGMSMRLDDVLPDQSVWAIKRKIQKRLGLMGGSPASVILKNGEQVLKDMMSVSECGISMGTVLSVDASRCRSLAAVVVDDDVLHTAVRPRVVDLDPAPLDGVAIIVNTSADDMLGLTVRPGHTIWVVKARVLELLGLEIHPPSAVLHAMRDREELADTRTVRECGINWGSNLYIDVSQCARVVYREEPGSVPEAKARPKAKARATREATSRSRSR
jgi:hypothetical protein